MYMIVTLCTYTVNYYCAFDYLQLSFMGNKTCYITRLSRCRNNSKIKYQIRRKT